MSRAEASIVSDPSSTPHGDRPFQPFDDGGGAFLQGEPHRLREVGDLGAELDGQALALAFVDTLRLAPVLPVVRQPLCRGLARLGEDAVHVGEVVGEVGPYHGLAEGVLGAEEVVERPLRHSGRGQDFIDAHRGESLAGHDPLGGVEDAAAGVALNGRHGPHATTH